MQTADESNYCKKLGVIIHNTSAPAGPADSQIKCHSFDQYFAFKHAQVCWFQTLFQTQTHLITLFGYLD